MQAIKMSLAVSVLTIFVGIQSSASSAAILEAGLNHNISIPHGEYAFAGLNPANTVFLDELDFSLAGPANITATVDNIIAARPITVGLNPGLTDIHLLTLSLFDSHGTFISAAGAGGTLSATGLQSGQTYTLSVSGRADGIFGGVYTGQLDVSQVPLPAAFPVFASALLALGWRRKIVGV